MNSSSLSFSNPFRPGAGHMPPYLAGRDKEIEEFRPLLGQITILENLVLTGLRGTGKTVLLETFKPIAIQEGWYWIGTDMSESTSISEENMAIRLLTDLSVVTSTIVFQTEKQPIMGFTEGAQEVQHTLNFSVLRRIYNETPGLVADKLKQVLETAWSLIQNGKCRGIIFAYDEAQTLADHPASQQYPLALLLDLFQSIQKKDIPFMLVLTGLPTLFPKLVEARTFAERMFHILFLTHLNDKDCRDAIIKPTEQEGCPVRFSESSVQTIIETSGGYPYFVQFICREFFDLALQKLDAGEEPTIPVDEIIRKLDADFFAGRWARATDRQRELLNVAARLENAGEEFTIQELVERSKEELDNPFSSSHASQMLTSLGNAGLVYKNRHGKYSFAVPLLDKFIIRQLEQDQ